MAENSIKYFNLITKECCFYILSFGALKNSKWKIKIFFAFLSVSFLCFLFFNFLLFYGTTLYKFYSHCSTQLQFLVSFLLLQASLASLKVSNFIRATGTFSATVHLHYGYNLPRSKVCCILWPFFFHAYASYDAVSTVW